MRPRIRMELLKAHPTKTDIQEHAVEQSCQQAVEGIREDIHVLGHRVETLENGHEAVVQAVADIQDTAKYHEEVLNLYRDQLDDHENKDRRQNIHIKGLPEAIRMPELLTAVISTPQNIEVDRVHRNPSYVLPNTETRIQKEILYANYINSPLKNLL